MSKKSALKHFKEFGHQRTTARHPDVRFGYRGYRVTAGVRVDLFTDVTTSAVAIPYFSIRINGCPRYVDLKKFLSEEEEKELSCHFWNGYSTVSEQQDIELDTRYYALAQKAIDAFIDEKDRFLASRTREQEGV